MGQKGERRRQHGDKRETEGDNRENSRMVGSRGQGWIGLGRPRSEPAAAAEPLEYGLEYGCGVFRPCVFETTCIRKGCVGVKCSATAADSSREPGIRNRETGTHNQECGIRKEARGNRKQEPGHGNEETGIRNVESGRGNGK